MKCWANLGTKCRALKINTLVEEIDCLECSFYKTQGQKDIDDENTRLRLIEIGRVKE